MAWVVRVLGVLIILVVVAVGIIYLVSTMKLNRTYDIPAQSLTLAVPRDQASIARGRHLAVAIAKCVVCHGVDFAGTVFIEAPPFRLVAPNLTSGQGGEGATLTDADFVRAVRHGVGPDRHGLLVMPSRDFAGLSDADLADIIAYVKSVPPVDKTLPDTDIKPLGRLLFTLGKLPESDATTIDHAAKAPADMPVVVTAEYGQYLARVGGCTGCHRANLAGGHVPGTPPDFPDAQNITPAGIAGWSEADFDRALRAGKRPDGTTINPFMPWAETAQMTDGELKALWLYVHSVPSAPTSSGQSTM